ncbi:MAG: hypothetical protein COT34_02380 [Candidatus Nealsonbacteria bacterium CG08_land_8_20_14_0_20_43_11]|uniref:M23ase beta-sheet core domain-containing protein n=1 Tax=Candidatus Nealsonbacteria bacterium CG08_land_8_20_14_0_20_43_11 TaxID=1974706 RepID=A0A2M6T0H8_9BACT|nr:MAG: hypothetical protein COT34_02380 [Candidatus Nealsonbacteria bacterium CG08_land_8_20_14_0_20_43_11]
MLKRKKNRILFILFLSVFLLNASFALAQKIEVQYPKLPLPFAAEPPQDFLKKIKDKEPGYTPEMMLPLYVKYFYSFAVLISGLVILGIITYGGFEILISAGNAGGMAAGRARISDGAIGLILLLSSYLILTAINPQLIIFSSSLPKIEECDCSNPVSLYCQRVCPIVPSPTPKIPVYIEIPLGRLIEIVIKMSSKAKYVAEAAKTSADELATRLSNLKAETEKCEICRDITTSCPSGNCSDGDCLKDGSSDCPNAAEIEEKRQQVLDAAAALDYWRGQVFQAKVNLNEALFNLEIAESLMRDALSQPLSYMEFAGLEEKQSRKLNHWADVDISVSGLNGGSQSLPTPPQSCSGDMPYEIVPSCTICENILFCYGNNYRLCDTDPKFNTGDRWFSPSDFPGGTALYNGENFPVPSGGAYVCGSNVFGCANERCTAIKEAEDPATFYVSEDENKDLISLLESLTPNAPGIGIPSPPGTGIPGNPIPIPALGCYVTDAIVNYAIQALERTGVRASLILTLLCHESGFQQYDYWRGRYPGSFCCGYANQCRKFEDIWTEVAGSISNTYLGFSIYDMPVSGSGPILGVENCGGALGPAQAMAFTWYDYKGEVKRLTGKTAASPWDYEDAFTFAGVHLKTKGGADSQLCADEERALVRYWGSYPALASQLVARANRVADIIGENHCDQPHFPPNPPGPSGGNWQLPLKVFTVLSSNAQDHTRRGSVNAWDFTAPCGTEIYPVGTGVVKVANCGNAGNYGCWVQIDHGDGWSSRYCHMITGSINVTVGQSVDTNTKLGNIGCTGLTSFGPHTHFEILKNYRQVDPATVFGAPASINLPYKPFCRNHACTPFCTRGGLSCCSDYSTAAALGSCFSR